tara:strand:- start:45 stop:458 length:414 start_codon:yes stop_codon:yes gene_type:complete
MIQQLMFGGHTVHTSTVDGIDLFFQYLFWRNETTSPRSFTYNYSPGILVGSSIQFGLEQTPYPQKQMTVTINPNSPDSVSSSGSSETPTLNFSGLITQLYVSAVTTDTEGDNFTFRVLNIDGNQNYNRLTPTTMFTF